MKEGGQDRCDIVSGGAETVRAGGAGRPSQAGWAFQESGREMRQGCQHGRWQVAEGIQLVGGTRPGADRMRWGLRTQQGPQPSLHLTHRNSFSRRYRSGSGTGLPRPELEPRGPVSGREGAVRGVTRRRTSPGGSGRPQVRAPERFLQQGGCWGPGLRTAVPTWHCDPGAGGERVYLVTPYALTAQPWVWHGRQDSVQGSQGHRRGRTRREGWGRVNGSSGGRSGRRQG